MIQDMLDLAFGEDALSVATLSVETQTVIAIKFYALCLFVLGKIVKFFFGLAKM